ncbi:MAG: hypothetical protein WCK00_13525, partial [Deltaproteobacteria bacterium]
MLLHPGHFNGFCWLEGTNKKWDVTIQALPFQESLAANQRQQVLKSFRNWSALQVNRHCKSSLISASDAGKMTRSSRHSLAIAFTILWVSTAELMEFPFVNRSVSRKILNKTCRILL